MAMGMGIHGEPGVWKRADPRLRTSWRKNPSARSSRTCPSPKAGKSALLINGLGATLAGGALHPSGSVSRQLEAPA